MKDLFPARTTGETVTTHLPKSNAGGVSSSDVTVSHKLLWVIHMPAREPEVMRRQGFF